MFGKMLLWTYITFIILKTSLIYAPQIFTGQTAKEDIILAKLRETSFYSGELSSKREKHKIVFCIEDWVLPGLYHLQVSSLGKAGLTWNKQCCQSRNLLWWVSSYSEAMGVFGEFGSWDCAGMAGFAVGSSHTGSRNHGKPSALVLA